MHKFLTENPKQPTILFSIKPEKKENDAKKKSFADPHFILYKTRKKVKRRKTTLKKNLLQKNKYDRIAFLDADLSTSLESCWALAKKINTSTKFVFGSRIKKIDNRIERRWYRFLVGRVIATFISQMLQLSVYDTQCGCKVFKPEIASLAFKEPFLSRWLFDVEVFYRLKNLYGTEQLQEFSKEIPLDSWVDKGDSKISLSYGFWVWIDLLTLYRFYK